MIVLDASAVLELLLQTERAVIIAQSVFAPHEQMHAPYLMDVEVAQVLRRLNRQQNLPAARAQHALEDYGQLTIERYAHLPLLARAFELRDSLTAYDSIYVALAEALAAPLLTCDARLARSHGHRASIKLA